MNPVLKTTLIVSALLLATLVITFLWECRTWPRGEDEPNNKIDWDKK
jgi:hypothetical protein